jgi:integrase/recombinase XerD
MVKGVNKVGIQIRRERGGIKNKNLLLLSNDFVEYEKIRGIKDFTNLKSYLKPFFKYLEIIGKEPEDISLKEAQEFQTYISTLKKEDESFHYASLSVATIMSITLRFYNYLRETGRAYKNPFLGVKRIRLERKLPRNIPDEEKMNKMLKIVAGFWKQEKMREKRMYYKSHVMAELMYASGMRIGEVLSLKEDDIDYERKVIHIRSGKGGKERYAYLNEYAAQVLKIYVSEMRELVIRNKKSGRLFGVKDSTTISATFHRVLKAAATACEIGRFPSHNFRHTLGYHLLKRGCDMRYIQLILGHADMNTTTIYTKVSKEDLKRELDTYHPRQFKTKEVKNEEP